MRKHDPDSCAACPRVFVREPAGFAHKGEILRDLNRPELAAAQTLSLSRPQRFSTDLGGAVSIELREQEPEASFVDAVALELNGRRIAPSACDDADLAFCRVDGQPWVMHQGDVLALEFDVDELDASDEVSLWAVGYYVAK